MTILQKIANAENSRSAREFAGLARTLMLAKGNLAYALEIAERENNPAVAFVLRAAVTAGTTLDDTWAGALAPYRQMAEGFAATLQSVSAFDSILADANIGQLHTQFSMLVTAATGYEVAQGAAKPVSRIVFNVDPLQERTAVASVVLSNDLLRFATSVALIEQNLRSAVVKATNAEFVAELIAATTPIASAGDLLSDLDALLSAVAIGDGSALHLLMSSSNAKIISAAPSTAGGTAFPTMAPTGGSVAGIPTHVSDAAGTAVVLVDARGLVMASDPLTVKSSGETALQMDDLPTMAAASGSPLAPVATQMTSLYQTDSRVFTVERLWALALLRTDAVASVSGASYGGSP